jgi:hypothetical protein
MPPGARTLLSAGPNGLWYFAWIERAYGPVERHIAVEAYVPEPAGLPANVEWVDADIAEGAKAVLDEEVDLLFSGQNIEHLWPEQLVSFLSEANRVIRRGGWLVVDSPNRNMTAHYRWSMSEHTVELTPEEASHLLTLAGFAVRNLRGLWLCRRRGVFLPLDPNPAMVADDNLQRLMGAWDRPEDSFLWWAEAQKVGEVDREAVRAEINRIYERNWEERVNRSGPGDAAEPNSAGDTASLPRGATGYVSIGPYMPLPAGHWSLTKQIRWSEYAPGNGALCTLEVVADGKVIASTTVDASEPDGARLVASEVDLDKLAFAVHTRVHSPGVARLDVPFALSIQPPPWRT